MNSPCNTPNSEISKYLNRDDVRSILGVGTSFTGQFSACSRDVGIQFNVAVDSAFPSQLYIAALLERGVRTLLYVGANDWTCNWVCASLRIRCSATLIRHVIDWDRENVFGTGMVWPKGIRRSVIEGLETERDCGRAYSQLGPFHFRYGLRCRTYGERRFYPIYV